jgi:hypothetical protein
MIEHSRTTGRRPIEEINAALVFAPNHTTEVLRRDMCYQPTARMGLFKPQKNEEEILQPGVA